MSWRTERRIIQAVKQQSRMLFEAMTTEEQQRVTAALAAERAAAAELDAARRRAAVILAGIIFAMVILGNLVKPSNTQAPAAGAVQTVIRDPAISQQQRDADHWR
jgi:hypothetical protein